MGKIEGFKSFNPDAENQRAMEEEKERKSLLFHNQGLHDQEEDAAGSKIDEATGLPINKTPEVDGTSPVHSEFEISKDDARTDVMGDVPDALPESDIEALAWIAQETARLEKERAAKKKGDLKKAA